LDQSEYKHLYAFAGGCSLDAYGQELELFKPSASLYLCRSPCILGEYFSVHIEIKDKHELIENGPYKFIRHPAYAGNIIQAASIPLILNAYYSLSISAVLIFLFLYRLKLEEDTLIREVKGYGDYTKRTYRLIPKVW